MRVNQLAVAVWTAMSLQMGLFASSLNMVNGVINALPAGYVPPLVSNGDLSMIVDQLGGQSQFYYFKMKPTIFREGRRYNPPASKLIPEGIVDPGSLDKTVVAGSSVKNGALLLSVKFKGEICPAVSASQDAELAGRLDKAWERMYRNYYAPRTHLFYNTPLSKVEPASSFTNGFLDPDNSRHGYGAGMEDCSIFGGLMLSLLADRYAVTGDKTLADAALDVFNGLKLMATVHGVPGFVARGVCLEDGKGICLTSSRDQYTHFVHGVWRYYHSPLCSDVTKMEISHLMRAIADRMIRNVTPENDYDSLRADGSRDPRGIGRMWNVMPHEAARLPMIYAVAWDICRDKKYYELYREFAEPAIDQSISLATMPEKDVRRWMPTYTLLQMQTSLEVLLALEPDPAMKKKIVEAMQPVAAMGARRAISVNGGEEKYLCACGEAALAQLMAEDFVFSEQQKKLLARSIMITDLDKVGSCRTIHLAAAFWRARRNGGFD